MSAVGLLLATFVAATTAAAPGATAETSLSLLFTGDNGGEIAPCG